MSGGTLDADETSLTVSGTLTQSGAITIDVANNEDAYIFRSSDQPWSKHFDP